MKLLKQYLLIVISVSIAIYPMCTKADHTILTAPLLAQEKQLETQEIQKADVVANTTEDQKDTAFVRNAKYLAVPAALILMIASLYGLTYTVNKSISIAHECGHALATVATGNKVTDFHISTSMGGPAYIVRTSDGNAIKDIIICLAGPVCGAKAYFMWGKLGEYAASLTKNKDQGNQNLLAKIGGYIFGSISALCHLTINLYPQIYIDEFDNTHFSDGAHIHDTLKNVSPSLGSAYPYILWSGLTLFAGYSMYHIYSMIQDLKKK